EPDCTGLSDSRRPSRTVNGESGGLPFRHVALQLMERLDRSARRRTARGAVAKPFDDSGDPLTVEVLAGDHDDPAIPEVVGSGKNAPVPERHDRLAAACGDLVEMLDAFGTPLERRSKRRDRSVTHSGNRGRFEPLPPGCAPARFAHNRSLTNVMRS